MNQITTSNNVIRKHTIINGSEIQVRLIISDGAYIYISNTICTTISMLVYIFAL